MGHSAETMICLSQKLYKKQNNNAQLLSDFYQKLKDTYLCRCKRIWSFIKFGVWVSDYNCCTIRHNHPMRCLLSHTVVLFSSPLPGFWSCCVLLYIHFFQKCITLVEEAANSRNQNQSFCIPTTKPRPYSVSYWYGTLRFWRDTLITSETFFSNRGR